MGDLTIHMLIRPNHIVLLDVPDYERVKPYMWKVYRFKNSNLLYAHATINGRQVSMHRFLLDTPVGYEVDHINGDGLDNRRGNLRLATHAQNLANQRLNKANTSGHKGVSYCKDRSLWEAYIKFRQRKINLGRFPTKEQAARAYDAKAVELFGKFARLNFPQEIG